ncbi:MAG: DEAD/DEAH box helicase family protein [Dolichospermum sp. DEX182a]|nr:DEAD/DEAH box helicase family protein [Dolichospermum sp. DEX182a]
MSTKFFTNSEENTLIKKFEGVFTYNPNIQYFDALVGYFRASGYFRIRPFLDKVPHIRILVGINVDKMLADAQKSGLEFFKHDEKTREDFIKEIQKDIENANYDQKTETGILQFIDDIIQGKIQVKAHPEKKIHAKVYILRPEPFNQHTPATAITGSSNLTDAGLGGGNFHNYEFNVQLTEYDDVQFATAEFEKLWAESVDILPVDIKNITKETYLNAETTPFELYIKLLTEYFSDNINYDADSIGDLPENFKKLSYQVDAVNEGFNMLIKHNGFILADVVGLGKTVIAAMVAKRFLMENGRNNTKILVVYPPAVEKNWKNTFKYFNIDKYTKFIINGSLEKILTEHQDYWNKEEYDLVIVDEAHKFRNHKTGAFQHLQLICKSPRVNQGLIPGNQKKVILVSATPLNNRPDDIFYQIQMFQDARQSTLPITNLTAFFNPLMEPKQTLHTFEFGNTSNFHAAEVKLNIIQNSIYGVDIERGAVDIARLRFWLSLIVDEKQPKALPNLDYKIVVGNSLVSKFGDDIIDIDWEIKDVTQGSILVDVYQPQEILRKISDKQKEFFSPDSDKRKLATDIRNLKIDLLISQLELMIESKGIKDKPTGTGKTLTKNTEIYLQTVGWKQNIKELKALKNKPDESLNFFDWKLDFPEVMNQQVVENVGFDIVIGNPPYKIVFDVHDKKILENKFPTFKRNNDLYVAFFECCFKFLKDESILSFITPNTFINGDYFKALRKEITSYFQVIEIIDFKESKVFNDPTVYVAISFIRKNQQESLGNKITKLKLSNEDFSSTAVKNIVLKSSSENPFKEINFLLDKFNKNYLDEFFYIKDVGFNYWSIGKGKKRDGNSIGNRILYSGEKKHPEDLPFIKGKDIAKNYINQPSNFLRHNYNDYLDPGVDVFRYSKDFLTISPKIVYRQTSNKIIAALDNNEFLCDKTVHIIVPRENCPYNLVLILALINSKLFDYFYKFISQETGGRAFAQVKTTYMKKLPLPNNNRLNGISTIYNEIITLKSQGKDTTALEQQIDNMVYKLYELTYEEVKIIDPKIALTEKEYADIKI